MAAAHKPILAIQQPASLLDRLLELQPEGVYHRYVELALKGRWFHDDYWTWVQGELVRLPHYIAGVYSFDGYYICKEAPREAVITVS